jgi:hypothetical protein
MLSLTHLLAAALLALPPEACPPPWAHPLLAPALRAQAVGRQLLDPRETRYVLAQPQDFAADLNLLRGRARELCGAPLVEEAARFPERAAVNDLMKFNRDYRNDLVARLALDALHEEELRAALAETDQLYRIWDAVRDARCDYYFVTVRRQALWQLRGLIGAEAYYRGQLPPHLPVWRLPRR